MVRLRYAVLLAVVLVVLAFTFFVPVMSVNNVNYIPDVHCPLFSSCPPAFSGPTVQNHFMASPSPVYIDYGAHVYDGSYTVGGIQNPVITGECPTGNGSMTTCQFTQMLGR